MNAYTKEWFLKNPEYRKEYELKNKERIKEKKRQWFLKNKVTILYQQKMYRGHKRKEISL